MTLGNHSTTTVAHIENAASTSSVQMAPTHAAAGSSSKTADNVVSASTTLPETLPVINTAKLIQSMGQSEMRVGMRTSEFGNITISTSATRDSISAQISLDHGELATVLATHLPEIEARLAGNQSVDVRIDVNRQGAGQGSGTPGGTSNGSADQSYEGRQQTGNSGSSHSGSGFPEQQLSPVVSAVATSDGTLNARLDIRV
jgi:flagellar hook-length control protein FliK